MTHLELNTPVKALAKKDSPSACPAHIPLRTLILGQDAVPADLLRDLLTASRSTLIYFRFQLNSHDGPVPATIQSTFPIIAPSLAQLEIWSHGWHHMNTLLLRVILPQCESLRWLGWASLDVPEWFGELRRAIGCLPQGGAELEGIALLSSAKDVIVRSVLGMRELSRLRTLMIGDWSALPDASERMRLVGAKQGVVVEVVRPSLIHTNLR